MRKDMESIRGFIGGRELSCDLVLVCLFVMQEGMRVAQVELSG